MRQIPFDPENKHASLVNNQDSRPPLVYLSPSTFSENKF